MTFAKRLPLYRDGNSAKVLTDTPPPGASEGPLSLSLRWFEWRGVSARGGNPLPSRLARCKAGAGRRPRVRGERRQREACGYTARYTRPPAPRIKQAVMRLRGARTIGLSICWPTVWASPRSAARPYQAQAGGTVLPWHYTFGVYEVLSVVESRFSRAYEKPTRVGNLSWTQFGRRAKFPEVVRRNPEGR